jgi:hypothetical protein
MAKFSISMSVEVDAEDYHVAYAIRDDLFSLLGQHHEVTGGPYEIDVEQQDGFDDEDGQPDEAQEWADFDPDC